jgi:Tol biopolymer transport system component
VRVDGKRLHAGRLRGPRTVRPPLFEATATLVVVAVAIIAVYRWINHVDDVLTGPEIREPTADQRAELRDQGELAFARLLPDGWVIFVSRGDGSDARRVGPGRNPAWSLDGRRLAFEDGGAIWVANADGRSRRRLVEFGDNPAWSPDGTRIAFDRGMFVGIYVIGSYGRRLRQLTTEGEQPAWSSDGRRIAFVSERDGLSEGEDSFLFHFPLGQLYVTKSDGTDERRLMRTETDVASPAWSPDGEKIAFGVNSDDWFTTDEGMAVVDADGGGLKQRFVRAYDTEPTWSPDGRWIALVCDVVGRELCAARSDGSGDLVRLSAAGRGRRASPAWRPDLDGLR